jgi:hypothetical protein
MRDTSTFGADAEVLAKDSPITIFHLFQRFLGPMTIVDAVTACSATLERVGVSGEKRRLS